MWDIIDKGLSTSVKLSKNQENELISHLIDDYFNGLKFANNDEFRVWMEYNWDTISYDDVYEQICGGNYAEDSVLYDEIVKWLDKNIPLPLDDDDIEQMKYDIEHDV